jgi:hypothetical protein
VDATTVSQQGEQKDITIRFRPYSADVNLYADVVTFSSDHSVIVTLDGKGSVTELARLSDCAYSNGKTDGDGNECTAFTTYDKVDLDCASPSHMATCFDFPGGFQAAAVVNKGKDSVVLAIAGTDWQDLSDLLADATWLSGAVFPSLQFQEHMYAAATMLKILNASYKDATITLTGHSLGGAVAQLVANASGSSAITFNAPGADATLLFFGTAIADKSGKVSTPPTVQEIENYRMYGDLVSTAGKQVGAEITLTPPISTSIIDNAPELTWLQMHGISTVIERLEAGAAVSQSYGPRLTDLAGTLTTKAFKAVGPYAALMVVGPLAVSGFPTPLLFDPQDLDLYEFSEDAGSPKVRTITFPLILTANAEFNLQTIVNGVWTSLGMFDELETYDFGPNGVNQFRFFIIDKSTGLPPTEIDPFTFEATFVEDGTLNGIVTALNTRQRPPELCSVLGNQQPPALLDQDVFEFTGTKGELVTIRLKADPTGQHTGDTAILKLSNASGKGLLRLDQRPIPQTVSARLPKNGEYYISVADLPRQTPTKSRFTGNYCLTLDASPDTELTFRATKSVE